MKIGFFGKLPGYGDFVQRNTNHKVIDYWDNWITQSIDASQGILDHDWKTTFFNSPIWRFHIQGGVVVPDAISGLMMPSIDSAGRCYPFVVICQLKPPTNIFSLASKLDDFHANCEDFIIRLLEQQRPDLDDITQFLQRHYEKFKCHRLPDIKNNISTNSADIYRTLNPNLLSFSDVHEAFLSHILAQQSVPISIWHTAQSSQVKQQYRYYQGMPPVEAFVTLLKGE
mgnify:FL=1